MRLFHSFCFGLWRVSSTEKASEKKTALLWVLSRLLSILLPVVFNAMASALKFVAYPMCPLLHWVFGTKIPHGNGFSHRVCLGCFLSVGGIYMRMFRNFCLSQQGTAA